MKKIIIINGTGGSGKDTLCNICDKYIPTLNISSVDTIKQSAKILGWNNGKTEKDRLFLSNLKLLSTRYNNHPYEYIKENINKFLDRSYCKIMFIHIREPKEIDKVKQEFNCKTLLVVNSNVKQITSNIADANVLNYKYDYIIDNSGNLEELEIKVNNFINEICEVQQ